VERSDTATPRVTGGRKMQSEAAQLLPVRVDAIVRP